MAGPDDKPLTHSQSDMDFDFNDFARMVDESLSGLKEGEVVTGRIVEINPVAVVVDIGYKAEGEIPIEEFQGRNGELSVKEGDKLEVLIEGRVMEGEEEILLLSHRRAGEVHAWETIETAYRDEGEIKGVILSRVKGGFRVDIGVPAFLPGSQVDLRPIKDPDSVLGQSFDFRVLKYSRRRRNVVLSRRVILEEERASQKDELLANLAEGQVIEGVVKNVVKYGAFIDLGGMDGLLHVSDMSWGRIQHPSDLVKMGDELKVVVLKFDRQKERISLGLKQLTPDPWTKVEEKYAIGSKVSGQVVNLVDYGAFVEIEPGLEGLIHVSEMSWTEDVRQANKVLEEGQEVEAVVISLDPEARKLALSLKRGDEDPWGALAENFPIGTIIEGEIKTITEFGVFVGIDAGIDGMVHKRDLTWTCCGPSPEEAYQVGQTIQAQILSIDPDKKRVALGVKQLTDDPWPATTADLSVGGLVKGKVVGATEEGTYVALAEGVEGLLDLGPDGAEAPETDQELEVRILELEPERYHLLLGLA